MYLQIKNSTIYKLVFEKRDFGLAARNFLKSSGKNLNKTISLPLRNTNIKVKIGKFKFPKKYKKEPESVFLSVPKVEFKKELFNIVEREKKEIPLPPNSAHEEIIFNDENILEEYNITWLREASEWKTQD